MTLQELIQTLRMAAVSENTITAMTNAYNLGFEAAQEAKQEQGEPVAWMYDFTTSEGEFIQNWTTSEAETLRDTQPTVISNVRPLYITPQQRKPLTDEQIEAIWDADTTSADDCKSLYYAKVIARAIEAAHGIKEAA